ncbi:hypothetical protein O3M35_008509 [Rhynocoris fuscipes]|uniref:Uncharacterized protein n=1 Tax=Rhynocoris fuscipes TaxID=488301 RepID=A0AAW1DDY7_9HEMI
MHVSPTKYKCNENMEDSFVEGFKQKCDGYVIQLSEPICFLNAWISALEITENRHVPKYLFLPANADNNDYINDVLSSELSDVTGFVVAAQVNLNSTVDWPITLWTSDFSLPAGTPERENIFLDKWTITNGFLYNNQLYYDKILNLNGREIRISTFYYPTYTVVENDTLEGTEGRMVMEFCRIHNCTYKVIDDGHTWGSIDISNGTAYGILGLVHARKVDMGYVGLYLWTEVSFYADYTSSWGIGKVSVLVPKPVLLSPWRTPFIPFDLLIWLSIFLSMIVSTIAYFIGTTYAIKIYNYVGNIGQLERFKRIAMAIFGVIVLQSPPRYLILKNSSIRMLFISAEILALILTSCYAAELASYLTVPQ